MAYYEDSYLAGFKKRFIPLKGISSGDYNFGHTTVAEGADKVKQNIITLFSINQGEVFFNPSLGSGLQEFLFEANDFVLRDTLDRYIRNQIKDNIPEISVQDVIVESKDIYVTIIICFKIIKTGFYDEVAIVRKRGVDLY